MTIAEVERCSSGKHIYPSFAEARRAARHVNHNHDDGKTQPYLCRDCHWWHVGNARPKPPRRRESRKEVAE